MQKALKHIIPTFSAEMHPLTLEFHSKEQEERFRIDYTNRSLTIVRLSMLVGAVQYLLFYVLDLMIQTLLAPGGLTLLLIIRLGVCAMIVLISLWSFTDNFKKHFQFGVSLVPLIAGFGVICMVYLVQNNSGYDQYHVGLMIIFFYIHVLLRLRFIYATMVGWTIFLMYTIVLYPAGQSQLPLINNAFFLVSTQLCGMIASYALEYYARTVFRQSRDLENRRRQIKIENDAKATELNGMREIQLSLLPTKSPIHPNYDIACSMKTATEVGGDFYDFSTSKNGKLTFAIGDATGHGAKASALVTAAKILFITLANRKDLTCILTKASSVIRTTGIKKLYMSLAVGRLYKNQLELSGAGMPPALIWRAATGMIEKISLNGMPLGATERFPYCITKIPFLQGDILLLTSDGLPELFNLDGEMYGYDKPEALLQQFAHLQPAEIIPAVENEMVKFSGDVALRDDVSVIAIKKK